MRNIFDFDDGDFAFPLSNTIIRRHTPIMFAAMPTHSSRCAVSVSSNSRAVFRSSRVAGSERIPRKIGSCINSFTISNLKFYLYRRRTPLAASDIAPHKRRSTQNTNIKHSAQIAAFNACVKNHYSHYSRDAPASQCISTSLLLRGENPIR